MGLYLSTAYSSKSLEHQRALGTRFRLSRLTGRRLPWGNTHELIPDTFMTPEPDALRDNEQMKREKEEKLADGNYRPAPMEHIDFHDRCDHEHFRYAPWSGRAQFWIYLISFGKGGGFLFLILGAWVALVETFMASGNYIRAFIESFNSLFFFITLPCFVVWMFCSLIIHKFPRVWVKPGKGPKWELNRRTAMITLFEYRRKKVTKKRAPFHEFD